MDRLVSNHGLSHLALHILSYVEVGPDINNCRLVCKDWKALIDSCILIAKRRLNFATPLRIAVRNEWEDFKEAYVNTMKCKNLIQVKKFIWCFELYLKKTNEYDGHIDTSPEFVRYSPIHWFVKQGCTTIAMFLVNLVSSLNEKSGHDKTDKNAFALACKWGRTDLVKALIEASKTIDIDLNSTCWSGLTGLM